MNELNLKPIGYTGPLRLTSAAKVREWPEQANGFALPAGNGACPFATETCAKGCYAKKGRMAFSNVQKAFHRNFTALLEAGSPERMAELIIDLLGWMKFRVFRIHVSGDFFSADYAEAWAMACAEFPDREFWAYTRSRDAQVLSILAGIPNLSIFLSADRDNWCSMLELSERFPSFGLCYYTIGEDAPGALYERGRLVPAGHPAGLVVFVDHPMRGKMNPKGACPVERARDPWRHEGACIRCRRCCGNGGEG